MFVWFLSIRWRKAKTATLTFTFYSGGEKKGGKYSETENIFFLGDKKNREGKGGIYMEKISPQIVKDIKKSQFRSWSRAFANFWRVSVSVSKNLVLEKSLGFGKFGLGKKVSVSVMGEFGLGIGFGQSFGIVI